jgi:hypothetical protein
MVVNDRFHQSNDLQCPSHVIQSRQWVHFESPPKRLGLLTAMTTIGLVMVKLTMMEKNCYLMIYHYGEDPFVSENGTIFAFGREMVVVEPVSEPTWVKMPWLDVFPTTSIPLKTARVVRVHHTVVDDGVSVTH